MPEQQELPERVTMGLLPYINAHALDEDYAEAAARREATDGRERPKVGRMGAAVLAVFAILAVTAFVQTSEDSASEESERQELVDQVKSRKAVLDDARRERALLTAGNRSLETRLLRDADDSTGLIERIALLNLRSGTVAVTGSGVEVLVDDKRDAESDREKVYDTDLQQVVNGLWQAGAEAISINGHRLTALSAIRHAGQAITVNFKSLRRPYTILVIGDPRTIPTRFADSFSGQTWLDLQREYGLRFTMRIRTKLTLPAAPVPTLRFVNQEKKRTPGREEE